MKGGDWATEKVMLHQRHQSPLTPKKSSDLSQDCNSPSHQFPPPLATFSSFLPPCPYSTPRCNARRYLCRTGSFIKPCFFSSRWEDLNELSSWPFWAPAFKSKFRPPSTQNLPLVFLSFHLSLPLCHSFLHLSLLPAGGKTLLSHHPAADRHAKVVLWVIASLIDAVCLCTLAILFWCHAAKGEGTDSVDLICSLTVLQRWLSKHLWCFEYSSKPSGAWLTVSPSLLRQVIAVAGVYWHCSPVYSFLFYSLNRLHCFYVPKIKASLSSGGLAVSIRNSLICQHRASWVCSFQVYRSH